MRKIHSVSYVSYERKIRNILYHMLSYVRKIHSVIFSIEKQFLLKIISNWKFISIDFVFEQIYCFCSIRGTFSIGTVRIDFVQSTMLWAYESEPT